MIIFYKVAIRVNFRPLRYALCLLIILAIVNVLVINYVYRKQCCASDKTAQVQSVLSQHRLHGYYRSHERGTNIQYRSQSHVTRYQYLLAVVYAEQLNAATKHYLDLLRIAGEWHMKGVEPLVARSRVYGLKCLRGSKFNVNETFYHYSRFFNITQVKEVMDDCLNGASNTSITSRAEFLSNSYRNITIVHFVQRKNLPLAQYCVNGLSPLYKQLFNQNTANIIDCTEQATAQGMVTSVEATLNAELENYATENKRFSVRRVVCVNALKPLSLASLKQSVSSSRRESIVFIHWQGARTVPSLLDYSNPDHCLKTSLQHSSEVATASSIFLNSLGLKRPFLSLHIRSERIIYSNSLHTGYTTCCLNKLHILVDKIMRRHKLLDVLLVRDYGKYGTDTCFYKDNSRPRWYCNKLSDVMMDMIKSWGLDYTAFDPVKLGTVDNSAFASLVEADALLHGSVLLTVGYGSFQGQLRTRFINQTPGGSKLSYQICPSYLGKEEVHGLNIGPSCESIFH